MDSYSVAAPTTPPATRRPLRSLVAAVVVLLTMAGLLATPAPAGAITPSMTPSQAEAEFVRLTNQDRANHHLPALVVNSKIADTARSWSGNMSSQSKLYHDSNLAAEISRVAPDWTHIGENVGYGQTPSQLETAFMNSSGHRANILGDYNQVGIGVVYSSNGTLWVTVRFAKASIPAGASSTPKGDRVGIRRSNAYYLRSSLSSGSANVSYGYGSSSDRPVMGDWDGNGSSTPGVFRNGAWYLRNSNTSGTANYSFSFGQAGDVPIVGDWNGDGRDTVGVWRNGHVYLRNANSSGVSNVSFDYGQVGDKLVTGDFDGNGTDTVGVQRGTQFLLRNSNSSGSPQVTFSYGVAGDTPLMGDWDGNGTDTVGLRRGNTFYLRNANSDGGANVTFSYGTSTDQAVVGAW